MGTDDEAERLRAVALQNAQSILQVRRRAEDELRRQSDWLRVTLASIGDAVITTDADGRITLMNGVAEALTGWTQADALGHSLPDVFAIIDEATRQPLANPAMRALSEEVIVGLVNHTLLVSKDGTERPIDDSAAPIRGPGGAMLGAVLIFRDITERHRAEAEREALLVSERKARAEAERASVVRDEFLAMLSHELRTPLNAIVGWTQVLRNRPPSTATLEQALSVIDRNARIQAQLVADLLDMSRIISGKLRIEMERIELPLVIDGAVEANRATAEAKGVEVTSSIEPFEGELHGDPMRLQQVVWNLLSNAIKFTPSGGRVGVVVEADGSHVEIAVRDTGRGIRPEFLPHVFELFRQADNSAAREYGGLGLGLAIVKQLVELHEGTVRVSSDGEGLGATFTVRLPVTPRRAIHDSRRGRPAAVQPTTVHYESPNLTGICVLAVDDEPDARDLIRRVLEDCGARVLTTGSADEALLVLQTVRPDVILSDIGMPLRDGYSFMTAVRRSGNRVPAAALTAFARPDDRSRALLAGYQTHVPKPVEPADLVATVAALVHKTAADRDR